MSFDQILKQRIVTLFGTDHAGYSLNGFKSEMKFNGASGLVGVFFFSSFKFSMQFNHFRFIFD
jgi:hypothetical protein